LDPITTMILTAVTTSLADSSMKLAFEKFKAVIEHKWGTSSPLAAAMTDVANAPDTQEHVVALDRQIVSSHLAEDTDVARALAELSRALKQAGCANTGSSHLNVVISGGTVQGVVGAEHVTINELRFTGPPKDQV
jgi:hypothetical protein